MLFELADTAVSVLRQRIVRRLKVILYATITACAPQKDRNYAIRLRLQGQNQLSTKIPSGNAQYRKRKERRCFSGNNT